MRVPTLVVQKVFPAPAFRICEYSSGPMGLSPALVIRSPSSIIPTTSELGEGDASALAER